VLVVSLAISGACSYGDVDTPSPMPATTPGVEVSDDLIVGPVPDELDVRLQNRDTSPLADDALVRFQFINRGPHPGINYRWALMEDGRLFVARHSGDTSDPYTPFDTDLPSDPTAIVDRDVVTRVRDALTRSEFAGQPPYQADPTVEDGTFAVVTARIDGTVHEVIYEAVAPAPVGALAQLLEEVGV
jgi:hypothetical protein